MLNLTYTLTDTLAHTLGGIDQWRKTILTTPIPLARMQDLQWNAKRDRIQASLALDGIRIGKDAATDILLGRNPDRSVGIHESMIRGYNHALATIARTWAGTREVPSADVVEILYTHFAYFGKKPLKRAVESAYPIYKHLFSYLSAKHDHPIVAASIAHFHLLSPPAGGPPDAPGTVARLASHLFLSLAGYDLNGLAVPEKECATASQTYHHIIEETRQGKTLTPFIQYCANALLLSYEAAADKLKTTTPISSIATWWKLNKRQEAILTLTEAPSSKITNRDVQKRFGVSQITASRDLSHLASLNLLYPHGHGRSVYYTRI